MVRVGEMIFDPIRKQKIIFRKTAKETRGELVEVEAVYHPSSTKPATHVHPQQEERFEVLEGSINTIIAGEKKTYQAGEIFHVPAGTTHEMWNGGTSETRVIWQTRPALHTDEFLEITLGLAQDGKTNPEGIPNLLQAAVIMWQYRREFHFVKPPLIVQRILFGLLAFIGHLRGYHGVYTPATHERD
ncbi:cupin domain-containing protein [Ktedonobacter robiniae]|uniref:Cupin type-2 domain-containing protein n=1 Tax=Ktedonobacter robiniae TaxID=2778365 RepID=A0ABQ3UZC1_9CHLR|nr:cupin domain-containing protein [Ktedonobacter robiniae]GHO58050.1 hypothetical protein KSB_65250 [Ktedonobacter robiniae]